ncbi:MAG: Re/Si-specific NAD(P)(+) transhydrogenase subunit alpha [Puniceicoccaceae bacterium]|nr:MAG: Re/Si-specific NAD(P)(+) transhydrogenase subunit alpha [Puniceicoccaceae bacterium]
MRFAIPKESHPGETRAAATPASVARLVKMGAEIAVEADLGLAAGFPDAAYEKAGATIVADRKTLLGDADAVLRVRKPPADEIPLLKAGALHLSFLDPFNEKDLLNQLAAAGISAVSMEMIPRTTRAQKMDALTSQANLAGYGAVLWGAAHLPKILPMMSTAAGTLLPARVFIIGAGVAGLQAIATARRLGAKVDAFDTRPVVKEQVQSLGARFVEIDLGGESGQTEQGYAKELTPEQIERQRQGMKKACAEADLVITTAQVFGRKAPRILTKDMVAAMKPGSVVVDMAIESGGNVEGSILGEAVQVDGVTILGHPNLAGRVPQNASQVYATNLIGLIEDFWDKEARTFHLNPSDELISQCLLTHEGRICHPRFAESAKS